ncbi:hypothetical protein CaCOL14_004180 [Colletotrichum acutatum]
MADLRTDETSPFLQRPPATARSRDTSPAVSATSASHKLTLFNGLAIVISLQIGSGIFSVPSQISQFVTAPGYGLLAWLFGGLLVWTGAASFIELGLRIPNNGGIQEYLRACYGEFAGFLFTWVWCTIIKPAANSMIATIFADYLTEAFVADQETLPPWVSKVVAASCIVIMTLMTALTIIIVLGCGVWAFGHGEGVPSSEYGWFGQAPEQREIGLWEWLGDFGTATFGALWCYAGWEMVGFVLGDMKNPRRDLPLVINGSMIVVIIGFMLMNAALYVCLPMNVMRTTSTVAVEFANRILGTWAGLLFCVIVSISAMGALNSNVFATAKLVVVARLAAYMIFFSSAIGLILLRRRDGRVPGAKAAEYSTWLINPVIFSAISGLLVVRGVISEPLQGGAILLVALLGVGFFSLRFGLRGFTHAETR